MHTKIFIQKEQLVLESTFGMTKYTSDFSFPCQYCLALHLFYRHTTTKVLYQFVPCQYHFNALIWHCLTHRHGAQVVSFPGYFLHTERKKNSLVIITAYSVFVLCGLKIGEAMSLKMYYVTQSLKL